MSIELSKSLALTAAAGMVAGLVACGGSKKPAADPADTTGAEPAAEGEGEPAAAEGEGEGADAAATDKECCKGKNECKGKGGCKTDTNACASKNECKGKGGCNHHCPK